jgi:hypothetical protein
MHLSHCFKQIVRMIVLQNIIAKGLTWPISHDTIFKELKWAQEVCHKVMHIFKISMHFAKCNVDLYLESLNCKNNTNIMDT